MKKSVYFCTLKLCIKMSHKTALKIYEIVSYVLILGTTALFVYYTFWQKGNYMLLLLATLLLALAGFTRMFMERERFRACDEENDELRNDVRRLTLLLAEEKKRNNNNQ